MFFEEIEALNQMAIKKAKVVKEHALGYFLSAAMAGIYISLAVAFVYTVGGLFLDSAFAGTKIIMGIGFSVALSLIIFAGSELFTSNAMVMAVGAWNKVVKPSDAIKVWTLCWLGNLAGSIVLALLFYYSGLQDGATGYYMAKIAEVKTTLPVIEIFIRGILCNIIVCATCWTVYRMKTESGKLIIVFWGIFAFFVSGFEHSIANMSLFIGALLTPNDYTITIAGVLTNLGVATIANLVGGIIFFALPYQMIAKKK